MTIYYFCPDENRPSGGVKQIYRHVDILNKNGFDAYVLHSKSNFRCDWFSNQTAVRTLNRGYGTKLLGNVSQKLGFQRGKVLCPGRPVFDEKNDAKSALTTDDFVVMPEYSGKSLNGRIKDLPMVIFNQGFFLTFKGYSLEDLYVDGIYHKSNLKAVMTVSRHDEEALQYVFPHINVCRIHNGIDSEVFFPHQQKKKQIAFIPSKSPEDVTLLMNILQCRGKLGGWKWVPIENLPQKKVARILGESLIYLNFSKKEGFGLPPLEAALCGCVVIGYDGVAGREFLNDDHAYPVSYGDIIRFSKTVEGVADKLDRDPLSLEAKVKNFIDFTKKHYSLDQEEMDVLQVWKKILNIV